MANFPNCRWGSNWEWSLPPSTRGVGGLEKNFGIVPHGTYSHLSMGSTAVLSSFVYNKLDILINKLV